tara:strand:+ start:541 stop:2187 length:1647 start_codon:yes stop_codon:yes gene_type:complete
MALLVLVPLVLILACGTSGEAVEPENDIGQVWEAWRQIDGADKIPENSEAVTGSILRSLVDQAGVPPYPFLTDLGGMRGQVPPEVPEELADVWRALVLLPELWPEVERSELVQAAISAMDEAVETSDEAGLVWEAWRQIDESYAGPEDLDPDEVAGIALRSLLELSDAGPYPFLADVGRLWDQAPPGVPEELADLWRGLALHQERWPEVERSDMVETAIAGMVAGLGDPSAAFFDAESYGEAREALEKSLEGSYLGIGARVASQDGRVLLFPFQDTPAEKAGVQAADLLLEVQGEPVGEKTVREVVDLVAGPEGTKVKLIIERFGEPEPLELDVFRGTIDLPSVSRQLAPGGIGYVFIARFLDNTGEQVLEALETLDQFDMLALILDLRSNTGGSLEAAADVAGQFLAPGSIFLQLEDRRGDQRELRIPEDLDRLELEQLPMVVLVDEATIGEGEALAAVLQESGRAVLMGADTFGAVGTFSFVELSDGSAIYLPTARWYTPEGRMLGAEGVQPDVPVPFEPEDEGFGGESQFNRAYDYLNDLLPPFR